MQAMTTKLAISPYSMAVPPLSQSTMRFRKFVNGIGPPPDTVLMPPFEGKSLKKGFRGTTELPRIPTWIPVVAVALGRADGRWLMHRRPPEKHHGGLWEFPGGKVEPDEVPDFALEREIREELGIALDRASLAPASFARSHHEDGATPIVILLYKSSVWKGEPQALEGGEVGWFLPAEIFALPMPPLDVELARDFFGRGGFAAG
jgi:8-oxo-dGTP diphosphatase